MPRSLNPSARSALIRTACLETLEHRRLLCSVLVSANYEPIGLPGYQLRQHMPASQFVAQHPDLAGKDLWNNNTFDPAHTGDPKQFVYDPHLLVDDLSAAAPNQSLTTPVPVAKPKGPKGGTRAVTTALPDIVPLVGGSSGALQPFIDKTEIPGHNLMRFTTAVGNAGNGPLTLTSSNTAVDSLGRQIVTQRIYKYDSVANSFSLDSTREAGRFVFHSGHGHFHFEGYASYRLRYNNGGQVGDVVMRPDGSEAVGNKVGFCLVNILSSFTNPSTGTSSTNITGYSGSGQPSTSCGFTQGINVGRADVYDSQYDGQWIDVTGVPNGNYFLEVTLDASNAVLESDETNNTVFVPYTLNTTPASGGVQPDRFEPNNSFAQATDLGESGMQTQSGLTIHITNESDYFRFTAASTGAGSVQLVIADRDVNLYLYDSSQNLLGQSTTSASGTSTSPSTETVNYNFVAGQTYYIQAIGFGSDLNPTTSGISSNYAVKVNVKPTVDVLAPTPTASAATGDATLRVHRNGPTSSPLTVNLTYGGTAVAGVDYDPLPASVIIGNEASNFDVPVHIKDGATLSANKTIIVNVSTNANYATGTTTQTFNLLENVKPTVLGQVFDFAASPHRIKFTFNEDVGSSLQASDLLLTDLDTSLTIPAASVQWNWDANANQGVATFVMSGMLPNGKYNALVAAGNVTDQAGNPLAAPGSLDFKFLLGDLNGDGAINFDDYVKIDTGFNNHLTGYENGDINHDGVVNFDDYVIIDTAFNNQ